MPAGSTCSQNVTITDIQDPEIFCPGTITVEVDTNSKSVSGIDIGTPSANDNHGIANISNDANGIYSLGLNNVIWTATDSSGNTATCDQKIAVIDLIDPAIICPNDINVNTDLGEDFASGFVLGSATASDNDSIKSITNNAPTQIDYGTLVITWIASDFSNNTSVCFQTVTVNDIEAPSIICPSDIYIEADESHLNGTIIDIDTVTVNDNVRVFDVQNNAPDEFMIESRDVLWTVSDIAGNTPSGWSPPRAVRRPASPMTAATTGAQPGRRAGGSSTSPATGAAA